MDSIKRIETIDLLVRFWDYVGYVDPDNYLQEDKEDCARNFLMHSYPKVQDPGKDIWNTIRTIND